MFFSFSNLFSASKWLALFEVIFLIRLDSLASKSVVVTKVACVNLGLKTSAAKASGVVIHLSRSVNLFSISVIFVL